MAYSFVCIFFLFIVSTYLEAGNTLEYINEIAGVSRIGTTDACTLEGGLCQDDSKKCAFSYASGLCPGKSTFRCCLSAFKYNDTKECRNVRIMSRDSWGARRPKSTQKLKTPVPDFFIHHTDIPSCTDPPSCIRLMKIIQNFHMDDRKWDDIGYSFLVGGDGNVYEGRGFDRVGAHTKGYNTKGLAASFIGNFTSHIPQIGALKSGQLLINCAVANGKLGANYSVFGHRDVGSTSCPGDAFYKYLSRPAWPHWHKHKP